MSIWFERPTLEALTAQSIGTMIEHVGIEYVEVGDDYIKASMPVDRRTSQPFGLLHGGASVVLAETLGSTAANWCINPDQKICVGLEINANHVRSARAGYVFGVAKPIHLGTSTQLWEVHIHDEQAKLVCVSRLTLAVLSKTQAF
jgi:1,4-dihydroxy-2-naphthoyl-CoA hydrolase